MILVRFKEFSKEKVRESILHFALGITKNSKKNLAQDSPNTSGCT